MRTYVVTFVDDERGGFRGRARCVRTGEEIVFTTPARLLDFFETMNAVGAAAEDDGPERREEPRR